MWWWAAAVVASAQEYEMICPPDPTTALVQAAADVEQSYLHLDGPGFDLARHRMGEYFLCIDEALSVLDVIQLHRARSLIAYVEEDVEASKRAIAALHALQPDWTIPRDLLPREHPLWSVIADAIDEDGDPRIVHLTGYPAHGWSVDGTRFPRAEDLDERGHPIGPFTLPADRAFVLQMFNKDGEISYTGYHFSTTDIPIQDIVVAPDAAQWHRKRRTSARWIGSVVGGSLLAASAITLGVGLADRQGLEDGAMTLDGISDVQGNSNHFGHISAGLAGGGAAIVTIAWSVRW